MSRSKKKHKYVSDKNPHKETPENPELRDTIAA